MEEETYTVDEAALRYRKLQSPRYASSCSGSERERTGSRRI
jgi:hypothetical protein